MKWSNENTAKAFIETRVIRREEKGECRLPTGEESASTWGVRVSSAQKWRGGQGREKMDLNWV